MARLEKFEEANPSFDYQRNLSKEGVEFCQGVMLDLNRFKRGISHNSTNPSSGGMAGSTEPAGNPQDNRPTSMQGSLDGVKGFPSRPGTAAPGGNSFANKFQSKRTSGVGIGVQGLSSSNNPALRPSTGQNLNSSFRERMSAKRIMDGGQGSASKIGGASRLTDRPSTTAQNALAQTINTGTLNRLNNPGANPLNTSNNQFKNRLQNKFN